MLAGALCALALCCPLAAAPPEGDARAPATVEADTPDQPRDESAVEPAGGITQTVRVTGLRFRGNRTVSASRLEEVIGIAPGDVVGPDSWSRAERAIKELYDRAGHPFASVRATIETTEEPRPETILVIDISEGPKARIGSIEITGNAAITADRLRSEMASSVRHWPPFLWPGRFDEATFQEDLWRIENLYHDLGYLDARVEGYWSGSDDMKEITLHVVVEEGPLYLVESVTVSGNTIFRDDELFDAITVKAGRPYLAEQIESARWTMAGMYGRQGYVDVHSPGRPGIEPQVTYAQDRPAVLVEFPIVEGQRVYVDKILIKGLTTTKELVVIRNLSFKPLEPVDTEELDRSERILRGTGYFDSQAPDPVDISLAPGEGTMRDVIVRVKEGSTGSLWLGGGVGTASGLFGQLGLREGNFDIGNRPSTWRELVEGKAFRGGGQRLNVMASMGSKRSTFIISLSDPSVRNTDYSLGGRIQSSATIWDEFDVTRTGAAVSMGKKLSEDAIGEIEIGFEHIKMDEVEPGAPFQIRRDAGTYNKPYVGLSLTLDRRDETILPSKGYMARLSAELAAAGIDTMKLLGEVEKHWTVSEPQDSGKHILSARGVAGVLTSYTGDRIPVFERFYAGGGAPLRGFEYRGVSPVEPTQQEQIGGESMLLGSLEYSLPLYADSLRLGLFVDAGYVGQDAQDILTGWDSLRMSAGAGLRWRIPALAGATVTIDAAVPLMKEDFDKTQALQFSVGAEHRF